MSINITVEGGSSKRLLTAGKYCPEDIVVTATGGVPEDLNAVLAEQEQLIASLQETLRGKTAGEGGDDFAGAIADRSIVEFRSEQCAKIGAYSFRGCEKLETLVAPNAKSVEEYALYNCSKLKSIVLPSVETVSANAFREASNLEVIDLPKLSAIPGTAFYGCRALKALILRSNTMVTLSSTSAFTQCYRMLGTKNPGYNPTGEKIGWVYVPSVVLDEYLADSTWVSSTLQFRAIEDYPEICERGLTA